MLPLLLRLPQNGSVEPTIISMVVAGGVGAWFGAGIVVNWPRQKIQRAMAIALVVTAGFMALRMTASLSLSEDTLCAGHVTHV